MVSLVLEVSFLPFYIARPDDATPRDTDVADVFMLEPSHFSIN